jgi:hypothetical protein
MFMSWVHQQRMYLICTVTNQFRDDFILSLSIA